MSRPLFPCHLFLLRVLIQVQVLIQARQGCPRRRSPGKLPDPDPPWFLRHQSALATMRDTVGTGWHVTTPTTARRAALSTSSADRAAPCRITGVFPLGCFVPSWPPFRVGHQRDHPRGQRLRGHGRLSRSVRRSAGRGGRPRSDTAHSAARGPPRPRTTTRQPRYRYPPRSDQRFLRKLSCKVPCKLPCKVPCKLSCKLVCKGPATTCATPPRGP